MSLQQELDALTAKITASQSIPRRIAPRFMVGIEDRLHRGAWCSYCNLELQALAAARADIEARGASIIAISMQNTAFSSKSVSEKHLGFPGLIDTDGYVAADCDSLYSLSAQMIELYRYLIAREGIVAYAEVNPDHTHRAQLTQGIYDPCPISNSI